MYLVLALASAGLTGIWSFGTGQSGRRMSLYVVIFVSASAAISTYAGMGLATGNLAFAQGDVAAGLLGGTLNFLGTILLLKALASGKMGVATGVSTAYVLIPLGYSLILGESISALAALGTMTILAGLVLFCLPGMKAGRGGSGSLMTIVFALGTAVLFGLAIVVLDMGSRANIYGTLTMSQVPQVTVTLIVVLTGGMLGGLKGRDAGILVGSGVALGLANLAFYTAAVGSNVGIVSVLGSLNPIATALLAFIFLKEALARTEILALVVVLAGTALVLA